MARVYLSDNLVITPTAELQAALQTIIQQLEDQINAGPAIASLSDSNRKLPVGMVSGDLIFDSKGGELKVGIYNGATVLYVSFGSFVGAITDAQHGTRSGGSLHDLVTTGIAGFMSAGDKVKIDHFKGQTTTATGPTTTELPANGDWSFHKDTTGPTFYLATNWAGVIKSVVMT
jgi:hypothetical protein